jgi:hypothetical protein
MASTRVATLRAEIESLEKEIVRINLEEEEAAANRAREAAKTHEAEDPHKKRVPLIDVLDSAIDAGEDYIFAENCVKRSEAKVAEYEGFATMGAYEAGERLEGDIADCVACQRKFTRSVQNVLISMRDTERERVQYLQKLGLDLATLKTVIGC